MSSRTIVAGGAGYIGAHVCVELLNAGHDVLVIDNFANSSPVACKRVEEITGKDCPYVEADLADPADRDAVQRSVGAFSPDGAVHLAGLKAVGESVAEPLHYYRTNILATITLLEALQQADAHRIVFSSSATVYGDLNESPVDEGAQTGPTNPYGKTKLFIEEILKDAAIANRRLQVCNLRYFNPVGAHASGRIGEDPKGRPNNLFPFIAQVAVGRREELSVWGDDYQTRDGTGVRDYIHVVDLAKGHVAALEHLARSEQGGAIDVNLGTGQGVSVLEAIAAFKRASNRDIPYSVAPRRDGDIAEIYADARRAEDLFGWRATLGLDNMCADHWRWQHLNPNGYESDE